MDTKRPDQMGIGMGGRIHHFRPLGVLRLWVPSVGGVEGSHFSRRSYQVVVSMLCHGELVYPVVLLLVKEWSEVCFNNLVDSFGLSFGLGVKRSGHLSADSSDGEGILPGVRCAPVVMIGYNVSMDAMEVPDFADEYLSEIFGGFLVFLQ